MSEQCSRGNTSSLNKTAGGQSAICGKAARLTLSLAAEGLQVKCQHSAEQDSEHMRSAADAICRFLRLMQISRHQSCIDIRKSSVVKTLHSRIAGSAALM